MIDILKGLLDMILQVINTVFNIPIPFYEDKTVKFGILILAVAFICIAIVLICRVIGFDFFGGDDE